MSGPRRWNRSARSCTSSSRRRHAPGKDAARPGAPYRIAAEKLTAVFGLELTEQQLNRLSLVFHYGLAIQWAPLYPLLRRRTGLGPAAAGLTAGAAMSVVADGLMTPGFGFSAPTSTTRW